RLLLERPRHPPVRGHEDASPEHAAAVLVGRRRGLGVAVAQVLQGGQAQVLLGALPQPHPGLLERPHAGITWAFSAAALALASFGSARRPFWAAMAIGS